MNLALLAKQGWHIVTRQTSLLYKVLKGRYFRRSPFIHAKLGANPSFGWRSVLEGRKVLTKGLRWQIGDGKSIDMWKDPWVPRTIDFYLRGERVDRPRWVSQLMRNGQWIKEEVERCVEGEDSGRVLTIPLGLRGGRDKWVWHHTRCGNYLPSSGYKCARTMKKNGELRGKASGEVSSRDGEHRLWGYDMHLLGPLRSPEDRGTRSRSVFMLWSLWKARNGKVFDQQPVSLESILAYGFQMANDYPRADQEVSPHSTVGEQESSFVSHGENWQPPQQQFLKIKTDVGWRKNYNDGATGAVDETRLRRAKTSMDVEVIVSDILFLTRHMDVKFRYVKRSINNASHMMAHWDHMDSMEAEWLSVPPNWLVSAL
ncbi:hypothetical protein LIER_30348 [Lithospermum erythrorhizon]|uniref:Uncharacterized protein n=1 Tax=Lithospermum erythrorhizon TaxID=34254 RepID=A0AAV3RMU8_LITER